MEKSHGGFSAFFYGIDGVGPATGAAMVATVVIITVTLAFVAVPGWRRCAPIPGR